MILSGFSKGQAVTLSVTLFVIDFFLKRNLLNWRVIIEKIPFLIISIIFGIVALKGPKAVMEFEEGKFYFYKQVIFASYGFITYIFKIILPIGLKAFYPYPFKMNEAIPFEYLVYFILTLVFVFLTIMSVIKNRKIAFGLLFFIINVALVIQLLPQARAVMADRFVYIPSLGLFIVIAVFADLLINNFKKYVKYIYPSIALYIVILMGLTISRNKIWKDSVTLWGTVLKTNPTLPFAWNSFGEGLFKAGQPNKAKKAFEEAKRLQPTYLNPSLNLGLILAGAKKHKEAIINFTDALKIDSLNAKTWWNRGNSYIQLKNYNQAFLDFNRATKLAPGYDRPYFSRGEILFSLKKYQNAEAEYNKAIKLNPKYTEAIFKRGITRINLKEKEAGCKDLLLAHKLGHKSALKAYEVSCK